MSDQKTALSQRRKKWSVLNPTPLERALIEENAHTARMAVGRYILAAALRQQPAARNDWRELVGHLVRLNNQLDEVRRSVEDRVSPLNALRITLALRQIEDAAFSSVMPWRTRPAKGASQ